MVIRKLELKDAPLMLEWMHDYEAIKYMQADFLSKKTEDCERFIIDSWNDDKNIHMAIINDYDEYMGTISLKNIDNNNKTAEFAIASRKCAWGSLINTKAMKEIIYKGFYEIGLNYIYWYAHPDNIRALKFYSKNGFDRVQAIEVRGGQIPISEKYILFMAQKK